MDAIQQHNAKEEKGFFDATTWDYFKQDKMAEVSGLRKRNHFEQNRKRHVFDEGNFLFKENMWNWIVIL